MVETSRVDFHEYFAGFKRSNGPFDDTYIMVQSFILLFALVLQNEGFERGRKPVCCWHDSDWLGQAPRRSGLSDPSELYCSGPVSLPISISAQTVYNPVTYQPAVLENAH